MGAMCCSPDNLRFVVHMEEGAGADGAGAAGGGSGGQPFSFLWSVTVVPKEEARKGGKGGKGGNQRETPEITAGAGGEGEGEGSSAGEALTQSSAVPFPGVLKACVTLQIMCSSESGGSGIKTICTMCLKRTSDRLISICYTGLGQFCSFRCSHDERFSSKSANNLH